MEPIKVIGIDVSGSGLFGVVYQLRHRRLKPLREVHEPWKSAPDDPTIKRQVISFINKMKEYSPGPIGIGAAGVISAGRIIVSPNIKGINGLNLSKYAGVIENDANAFALAEHRFGVGRPYKNAIYITLGTGLGAGIIIDGKLYKGEGRAGELGHMIIRYGGITCTCGQAGCLEEYVSARAVKRITRRKTMFGREIDPKQLSHLAMKGSDHERIKARLVFNEIGRSLGVGLTNIVNIFDPEAIIIGGRMSEPLRFMVKGLRETFCPYTIKIRKKMRKNGILLGYGILDRNGLSS